MGQRWRRTVVYCDYWTFALNQALCPMLHVHPLIEASQGPYQMVITLVLQMRKLKVACLRPHS